MANLSPSFSLYLKNGFIGLIRENQWIFGKKRMKYVFWCPIFFAQCTKNNFSYLGNPSKSLLIALCESLKFLLYCTVRIPESLWYCTVWIPESLILHRVKPLKAYLYCTVWIPESPFYIPVPQCDSLKLFLQCHCANPWNSIPFSVYEPLIILLYCTVRIPEIIIFVNPQKSDHNALCEPLKVWS